MKKVVILGAGGNSKVVVDVIKKGNGQNKEELELIGFLDDDPEKKECCDLPVLGRTDQIGALCKQENIFFVNGIGNNVVRKYFYHTYPDVQWISVIHPSAVIAEDVIIEDGAMIMPGAIINPGSKIGKLALINTGVIVEHDNEIGAFAHVASGVVTAGNVYVGECAMLGTGSRVIQGIKIGANSVIGAGACVISDIPEGVTAVGVPARVVKHHGD